MGNELIHKPPAYRSFVHPSDRRCKGRLARKRSCRNHTEGERYFELPTGRPPFVEVRTVQATNFLTGEPSGSWMFLTEGLVGFIDPFTEFLAVDEVLGLFDSLELLTTKQAGEVLGCSARYLEKLRRLGRGPRFWRIADGCFSYSVRYERLDLDAYALEKTTRPERRGGRRDRRTTKGVDPPNLSTPTPFENVSEQIYDV